MLNDQFGISENLKGIFLQSDRDNLFFMSEELSEVLRLEEDKMLRIDRAGLFIGSFEKEGLRLTVEGTQLFGPLANKKILTIDEFHLETWMKGEDFDIEDELEEGFHIIKHNNDFFGCALLKNGVVRNNLMKSRVVKNVNN